MVGSVAYHLAQGRGGLRWGFAGMMLGLQTAHVHQLYQETVRRVERDQPLPAVPPGQWLLRAFGGALMLLIFVT